MRHPPFRVPTNSEKQCSLNAALARVEKAPHAARTAISCGPAIQQSPWEACGVGPVQQINRCKADAGLANERRPERR